MIDLRELKRVADLPGDREVVSRAWLQQVHLELQQARTAAAKLPPAALEFRPPAHRG